MTRFVDSGFDPIEFTETADGHRFLLRIRNEAPVFRGHFPNRPILPGVAQLALLELAFGQVRGRPTALGSVHGVRFRRIVGPGEILTLDLRAADGSASASASASATYRFDFRVDGEAVSSGTLRTLDDPAAPFEPPSSALAAELTNREPFVATGRVPHAPPARLVERLVAWSDDAARAKAEIPVDSPFAAAKKAPTLLAIEIAAQTAALFEAATRSGEAPEAAPREGYLVLVRRAHFATADLPTATRLHATIRRVGSAPPLALYEFEVAHDERVVALGTLGTFLTGEAAIEGTSRPAEA